MDLGFRRLAPALAVVMVCSAGLIGGMRPAGATATFARQYRTKCSTCHTVFPQLNDFGRAFLLNNFRVPGQEKTARLAWHHTIPFSFQVKAHLGFDTKDNKTSGLIDESQLHGSGLFTKQDAFYLHHHLNEGNGPGDTYEAWIQHALPGKLHLNLRLGQFEQPLGITPEIQTLPHSEYLVYGMPVGLNDFAFAAPARGLTLSGGSLGDGIRFAVSVNQPRRLFEEDGGPKEPGRPEVLSTQPKFGNVFARVQQQVKGKRIGLFGYLGRAEITTDAGRFTDHFSRVGVDAEAQLGQWRLYGLWLTGHNSNPSGTGEGGSLNGGFVGVDYHIHNRYVAYVRYDRAHSRGPFAEGLDEGPVAGVTWLATQNWRLILEYDRRRDNRNGIFLSTHAAF